MNKTILYSSRAIIPSRQANSIHIMKMCSAFVDNGFSPILLCHKTKSFNIDTVFDEYGVKNRFKILTVPNIKFPFSSYLVAIIHLFYYLKYKPKYSFGRFFLGIFFISFFNNLNSLELHQPIYGGLNIQHLMLKKLFKKKSFKNLILISNPLKEIFLNLYNIKPSKIKVLADAADNPTSFYKNKMDYKSKPKVGYVGHLYKGRGIELIIKLAKELPEIEFHIVGGNSSDIKRVKNEAIGLYNLNIHGYVKPSETETIRQSMNILIAPYQYKVGLSSGSMTTEKWMSPLKIFEYMASGRAIISSDIPVLKEVLIHDYNCLLCDPENHLDWKKNINELIKDEDLLKKISSNARNDFLKKYTWTMRAKKIFDQL